MLDSGSGAFRAWIVYRGVQLGGRATWAAHDPAEVSDDLILMEQAVARWERADTQWRGSDKPKVPVDY